MQKSAEPRRTEQAGGRAGSWGGSRQWPADRARLPAASRLPGPLACHWPASAQRRVVPGRPHAGRTSNAAVLLY